MAKLLFFDKIEFGKKIGQTLKRSRYEVLARNAGMAKVTASREKMIDEFDNHPVTQELQDGEDGFSEFLSRGNLFSFIGFDAGVDPTEDVRKMLVKTKLNEKEPKFKQTKAKVTYEFNIEYPDIETIYKNTPTPDNWSSKSWTQLIEDGISNFGTFIYHEFFNTPKSRSTTGLQSKSKVNTGNFRGVKYLSIIIENFKKRFRTR